MNTGYYPFRWIRIAVVTLLAVIGAAILFSVVYGILNPAQSPAFPRFGFLWFGPFIWFVWIFIFLLIFGGLRWLLWPWRGRGYHWHRYDPAMQHFEKGMLVEKLQRSNSNKWQ